MSQPIDVPGIAYHRRRRLRQDARVTFPPEDGPYFGLIEVFESGDACWMISSGNSSYVRVGTHRMLPRMAFIVEKNRISKTVTIDMTSTALRQAVFRAILDQSPSQEPFQLDFAAILRNYRAIKFHLRRLQLRNPHDDLTSELALLTLDFLLERSLFEGLGLELFQRRYKLHAEHLQDIHRKCFAADLGELKSCFSIGLVPETIYSDILRDLNTKFADFILLGDEVALRELCEPLVRSGELWLIWSDDLLLHLLRNTHLDAFMYVIDLLDRLHANSATIEENELLDITFDPFLIAIRLGHVPTAQAFAAETYFFEGCFRGKDDSIPSEIGLEPLTAAVFWDQPEIVTLLLNASPVYVESLEQAMAMAAAGGKEDVLERLNYGSRNSTQQFSSRTLVSSLSIPFQLTKQKPQVSECINRVFSDSLYQITSCPDDTNQRASLTTVPSSINGIDSILSPPSSFFGSINLTPSSHFVLGNDVSIPVVNATKSNSLGNDCSTDICDQTSYLQETLGHQTKRQLGQSLVARLGQCRTQLRQFLASSKGYTQIEESLLHHTTTCEVVWESGIEGFYALTKNQAPSSLAKVLTCLFVADAVSLHLSEADPMARSHFLDDLDRWRLALQETEQGMFDSIAAELWPSRSLYLERCAAEESHYFHELAQNILMTEVEDPRPLFKSRSGLRLHEIQNEIDNERRKRELAATHRENYSQEDSEMQNIGSVLSRLTKDTDSGDEGEEIEWADYIHLSALEEESSSGEGQDPIPEPPLAPQWTETEEIVGTLLASPAFSMILGLVTAVRHGDKIEAGAMSRLSQLDTSRPCGILERFLSLSSTGGQGFAIRSRPSEGNGGRGRMARMKANSRKQHQARSLSHSLATSFGSPKSHLRASLSSPGASSFFSATDLSSTDTARSTISTSERFRCLSSKCPKTFSSVSNRNKHMREGCTYREKKRYRCRNGECSKLLSTKWYRNTHEQTRCRFK